MTFVLAGAHSWSRDAFTRLSAQHAPGTWTLVERPEALDAGALRAIAPRYVFFLHWSWRVPQEIVAAHECVGFHMTDLPYGRGGAPLQNLILRGHRTTMLSAFRLSDDMDAGPVYAKRPLALDGRAQEIYRRAADLAVEMIQDIVMREPVPMPQQGEVVTFRRRTPAESRLPAITSAEQVYDFIRMLDADGYPKAFIEQGDWRYEFSNARVDGADVRADVRLTRAGRQDA